MRRIKRKTKGDASVPLINIVFLMLVFFVVAGTVAQPLDPDLSLIETSELEGREPPNALVLHADGRLSFRGEPVADIEAYLALEGDADISEVRIVPDRAATAERLVEIARSLRAAGADSVIIVTERAIQ